MSESIPGRKLPRLTELAHELIGERLNPGDRAIDATAGNGFDTVFLAEKVGPQGRVFGFDIQPEAIAETRRRLGSAGLGERVSLFEMCHSRLGEEVCEEVSAAMFNLGYLPGGDKSRVTQLETTLLALEAAQLRLVRGGLLTVIVYPGHPGGDVEASGIEAWAVGLDQGEFTVIDYGSPKDTQSPPPRLIAVERR